MIIALFGKGGAGKSTIALAMALALGGGKVVTTDPIPTLRELMPNPPPGIEIVEYDYDTLREMWKGEFGEEFYRIISTVADVDKGIVDYVASAPGIVEQYAVYQVLKHEGDLVIWDTQAAPGAMTLIRAELEFYSHLRQAVKYWSKLKGILAREFDVMKIIERWRRIAEEVLEGLKGVNSYVVVNPDKLSLSVGRRLADELEKYTNFRGYILNKWRGEGVSIEPLVLRVPYLEDPSPWNIAKYLEGFKVV